MNPNSAQDRRRIVYVDHVLQKWLLAALVVLECVLTGLAIWGLYLILGDLIDRNMYRVHFSPDDDILRDFAVEGAKILIGTGVINLAAIILADRIWAVYVGSIVRGLDKVMLAARDLDLMQRRDVRRTHVLLDRVLRWQRSESLRLRRIRHSVRHLPDTLPETEEERAAVAAHLRIVHDRGDHALGE
ncbi:MAG TPA: hypothetical protein VGE12_04575 [Noviherbaspirillum sp.]